MKIELSVNNRQEVMIIPVTPPTFTITKPQGGQTFETVTGEELQLIGVPKLKGFSYESFFPVRDYTFLEDRSMKGWGYVDKIDKWILEKLPIRLIVTDTPINMAAAIKNFEYTIKSDGDLWYKLEFEEFNLLDCRKQYADEEEIDMEELETLKQQVEALEKLVAELDHPFIYDCIDENMPEWAREAVQAAVDAGAIVGDDDGLDLRYDDLRHITMLHRLGLF